MFMKPGDLIEWYYIRTHQRVSSIERIFSSAMPEWINVGGVSILISNYDLYYNKNIHFINFYGKICNVCCYDSRPESGFFDVGMIAPRILCVDE